MALHYSVFEISPEQKIFKTTDYQYWLILSGTAEFSSGSTHYSLASHDVLEIPQNASFHLETQAKMQIGCVTLTDFRTNNHNFHRKDSASTEAIRKVFFFILDFQGVHHTYKNTMLELADRLMLEALLTSGLKEYEINPALARVIEEFNQHFADPDYDINPAISKSGYSQSHFRKMFREATGTTPVEYLQNRRIDKAKYLLSQNICPPMQNVAAECGFTDVYYFSRLFHRFCGMSPTQYRKDHQDKLLPEKSGSEKE